MTAIFETPTGEMLVLSKGADSILLPLCNASPESLHLKTQEFIDEYAKEGLRTLVLAQKKLSKEEYD